MSLAAVESVPATSVSLFANFTDIAPGIAENLFDTSSNHGRSPKPLTPMSIPKGMSTEEVFAHIAQQQYTAGNQLDLLRLSIENPHYQQRHPVAALGCQWVQKDGVLQPYDRYRHKGEVLYCPYLDGKTPKERFLGFTPWSRTWPESFTFIVVSLS